MSVRAPLSDAVLEFERDPFVLGRDLGHLDSVRDAAAPEAVVLYVARILEALVREAVDRLGQRPSPNLLSNLHWLQSFDLLDTVDRYVVHAVRRLGNEARHVGARHDVDDGEIAIAFLSPLLDWFFCRFAGGPQLPGLTDDEAAYRPSRHPLAHEVIDAVTRSVRGGDVLSTASIATIGKDALPTSPGGAALLAMAAEALMRQDALDEARDVLDLALGRNPKDARLAQLQGLLLSRGGQVDDAIRVLRTLRKRDPGDEETIGILAGALKRKAGDDASSRWLRESHEAYADGWQASRLGNTWLGINAATTALRLGDVERARSLASEVHAVLTERAQRVDPERARIVPYWTQVTHAEALLLMGQLDAAGREFQRAFDASDHRPNDVRTTREQAERILADLDASTTLDALLGG